VVRITGFDAADVGGRLALHDVLRHSTVLESVSGVLPASWSVRPVWIAVRAAPHLARDEPGRAYLTINITRLSVGRLNLPAVMAAWIGAGFLRWDLPDNVEEISLEPGLLTARFASSRPRNEAGGRK
jgi:hypothetical protein